MTSKDTYALDAIVSRAFKMLTDHPREFLLPAFIVSIPIGLLTALGEEKGAVTALTAVATFASLLVSTFFYGYFSIVANKLSSGNSVDLAPAFVRTVKKFWQMILVSIVSAIAVGIGVFLLIVPGLYLITIWFVFIPALVLEDVQYFNSLTRSRELVRGYGWSVFVTILFWVIAGGVIYIVFSIPTIAMDDSPLLLSWIATTLGDAVVITMSALIFYFAYERLVELKSAAQESTVADALPGTDAPPPTSSGPPQT